MPIRSSRTGVFRSYSELIKFPTFKERFDYLTLGGHIGDETFGTLRYLNQQFYKSYEWKKTRQRIILRDEGCDLAVPGYELGTRDIMVHHINPITPDDILDRNPCVFDPDNLITISRHTHYAITHGSQNDLRPLYADRFKGDTAIWR